MSRYQELLNQANAGGPMTTVSKGNQNQQTNQTVNSNRSSSQSASNNERSTTNFNEDNMSSMGRQALEQLLAQMAAGGTDAQRGMMEDEEEILQRLRLNQQEFSRENAFSDAEGLMSQMLRRTLEENMPAILAAQSGAGSSGDAISALLSQDLATRAAEGSAALGVQTATDYGSILSQLLGQEASMTTNRQDRSVAGLLQALNVDKGSRRRGSQTTSTSGSSSQSSNQSATQTTIGNTNTQESKTSVQSPTKIKNTLR